MKPRLLYTVCATLILIIPLTFGTKAALASSACAPAFVNKVGDVIRVSPTGVDDTENLQCAFDEATAGTTIHLMPGTFHTAQIIVHDFHGRFTGSGEARTIITNLPELVVTPVGYFLQPPSPDNPWPTLFAFINSDFSLSDLAIHISGEHPTTGWQFTEDDLFGWRLAHAVAVLGTHADVEVGHVLIEGEWVTPMGYRWNLMWGIAFTSVLAGPQQPISGSLYVHDSSFMNTTGQIVISNVSHTSIVITKNNFQTAIFGVLGNDFVDSSFEFSHNRALDIWTAGIYLYNEKVMEDTGSNFLIKTNVFSGEIGPALDQTFGAGNQCLLLGNNVQNTSVIGIYLGPGIRGCTVVGGSNKTNVLDLGIENILVGVNNMGTGVGPSIRDILKEMR